MALIEVGVSNEGLYVTADKFGTLELPLEPEIATPAEITVWGDVCEGQIYPEVVSEWFSDVLETDCQLVYMPDDSRRRVNPRFDDGGDIVSFADGYPLMLIGEASLAELNSRLDVQVPMNRFRPNLTVSGTEAFAEDDWKRIRIGSAVFRSTKPCARCVMTTVEQARGEFDGKEPLKTLASYRMAKNVMPERIEAFGLNDTAVLFGQNLIAETPGAAVNVGDQIEVIESY